MPVATSAPPAASPERETAPSRAEGHRDAPEEPGVQAPWCLATALVGLVALAVRVSVVLIQPIQLHNDAADYQRLAVSLATGHGFGLSHFAPGGGPTALRPPLFPLFLGALYKVVGTHVLAGRLAGAVLGALAVVLVVVVTWLLCGRAAGLVAGGLAAVFPPQVMATTSLMSESLALPLELAAVLGALVYRRTGRTRWAAASGVALGLLVLTRPSLAVLAVPLAFLLYRRRPAPRQLASLAALVLAGMAVVAPWIVRDRVVMHAWVPVTTQSGYVLAGTYNATSADDRRFPAAWRPADLDPADARLVTGLRGAGEVRTGAALQSAAFHYLSAHPSYLVTVAADNSRRLFDLVSISEVQADTTSEYGYPTGWGSAEMVSGPVLLVVALGGLATAAGRRLPYVWLAAPVLLWWSTVVLQAVPRFRAVIDPFLLTLAALALVSVGGSVRRRLARSDRAPVPVG